MFSTYNNVKFTIIMSFICFVVIFAPMVHSSFGTENLTSSSYMTKEERVRFKQESIEMFYHAYNSYMKNAYPADELMPLSCTGRYRGSHSSRGNVDETLGNFSLTLIDSLDTLVVIGNLKEFGNAVKLVIRDVNFDRDVVISVFETNIRVLGGLLSAHVLADYFKRGRDDFNWYNGELLDMAKDLGYRLLPAFNTTTGIPYSRVNLKRGINSDYNFDWCDTCTACAGTMILEMAALSRLTGVPVFEEKAHRAMDELWNMRHRTSNLMGTILNVHSGDWIRKDSGVGAGIDSYYEYCLKAYILLSDDKYLRRFNKHYLAIMTYVSQGPMLLDVHMHKPETNSKNFMDALLAFWPGLQVLKGDLKPAIETHEMLYQVMQKHNFIPEAFTTDFQVLWGQHPLRPEFIESTYFLFKATGDHHYLRVGKAVLKALQTYARVPCGFASVSDVRTGKHEDSMDSFVLAETLKYLYLLFADSNDLLINLDDFIFTTEGHLLPLSISRNSVTNYSYIASVDQSDLDNEYNKAPQSCSLDANEILAARNNAKNVVDKACPFSNPIRKLIASEFQASNDKHIHLLNNMGIHVLTLKDGRVQLHHSYTHAASPLDAEEGLLFMQEMIKLSKMHTQENNVQSVSFTVDEKEVSLKAGPAHFGKLLVNDEKVTGIIGISDPIKACSPILNDELVKNKIAVIERGDCLFAEKARNVHKAGAIAGIVIDNLLDTSADTWPLFAMSGDGSVTNIDIPFVFLFFKEGKSLITYADTKPNLLVTISAKKETDESKEIRSSNSKSSVNLEDGSVYIPEILFKHRTINREDVVQALKENYFSKDQTGNGKFKADIQEATKDNNEGTSEFDVEKNSRYVRFVGDYSVDNEYTKSENFNTDIPKLLNSFQALNKLKKYFNDDLAMLNKELDAAENKNPKPTVKIEFIGSKFKNMMPLEEGVDTRSGRNVVENIDSKFKDFEFETSEDDSVASAKMFEEKFEKDFNFFTIPSNNIESETEQNVPSSIHVSSNSMSNNQVTDEDNNIFSEYAKDEL